MIKILVFAILLASTPATSLMENLFRVESGCYKGCQDNFAAQTNIENLKACKQGCDFKLHNEDCASQCASISSDKQIQSSCEVGCGLSNPVPNDAKKDKDTVVDPNPEIKKPEPAEPEHHRSIILIRLRQRPSIDMPSVQMPIPQPLFTNDPFEFFNNIIKQFQQRANNFEQTIRNSPEQNAIELPKPDLSSISDFIKNIPINPIQKKGSDDSSSESSSESSEEKNDKRPLIGEFRHIIKYSHEQAKPINNRVQQFFADVRNEWNDLVRKQPKIPIWIFIGTLLASSAILWYMVMSLCRHRPSREPLSIRAQELIFHPYEYDVYEKEKIQPDDQPYEVTESLPIKVKLTNI